MSRDKIRYHSVCDVESLKGSEENRFYRQLPSPTLPSASSDEDIDPELKEGIDNILKLRDEYDLLEGALRKLGVNSENTQENHRTPVYFGYSQDETDVIGSLKTHEKRKLDILEEVDESILSSETSEEIRRPWIQMSLPGGGLVSLPLSTKDSRSEESEPLTSEEPLTHLHLDQLLEIVQSFQLDTTMASTEQESTEIDLQTLITRDVSSLVSQESDCCEGKGRPFTSRGLEKDSRAVREIHSCPSSPTETDCSSGFSTLRRRSVTLTEKIRTNRDGSQRQVVRQYGCNTSSPFESSQTMTIHKKNSFVYSNGILDENQSLRSSSKDWENSIISSSSSPPSSALLSSSGRKSIRCQSTEPNTLMFKLTDYESLVELSVPEIIDELEGQFGDKLTELQGVRRVGDNVYICLRQKESLNRLHAYGFYIRGVPIRVVDITHDSILLSLTGVPHYISDSSITHLVSTFGIALGDIERRFYKGVDTGERFVRLKPRSRSSVPNCVTVGGLKILLRIVESEEICRPFTLNESLSGEETAGNSKKSHYRAKPCHDSGAMTSEIIPEIPASMSPLSLSKAPLTIQQVDSYPKIAKSFRSLIKPISPQKSESASHELLPSLSPPPYKASSSSASPAYNPNPHSISQPNLNSNTCSSNSSNHSESEALFYNGGRSLSRRELKGSSSVSTTLGKFERSSRTNEENSTGVEEKDTTAPSSKTVNGILRKGSEPTHEIVTSRSTKSKSKSTRTNKTTSNNHNNNNNETLCGTKSKRTRLSKNEGLSLKSRSRRPESKVESSGSKSTKTSSGDSSGKTAKDLALTKDLPWCGCWGNGCL